MFKQVNTKNIFFLSDTHFGHRNVLNHDRETRRGFKSIQEHDEYIVEQHNLVVGPNDPVFIIGDVAFRSNIYETESLLSRMNGELTLVVGNHEQDVLKNSNLRNLFVDIFDYLELSVEDPDVDGGPQGIALFHYPIFEWNKIHHGWWHLYGHTHGNSDYDKLIQPFRRSLNVGVHLNYMIPFSYEQVKEIMLKKPIVSHH
jgi:calcineurin-like phosphoesterase family protein